MGIKGTVVLLVGIVFNIPVLGQNNLFNEAFTEFATRRLWDFEEIPVEWKMEGVLQADLNEGLNNLLENNPGLADESLSVVIAKNPNIWQAYYYRSAARKQRKKFYSAKLDIQKALGIRGDFYEGLVELAKILHFEGDTYESERTINKAIRLDKTRGAAYYLKGDINMAQNQLRSAIKNYKDCVAADSLFHDARIKLALLDAVAKKNEIAALPHLNRVLQYDSLNKNALLFRSLLNYQVDKAKSVRDLSKLILVSPNNVMALYYRGVYSAELGDFAVAFSDFHKVIQMTAESDNSFQGKQTWLDKKIDLQNAGAYAVTRVYGLPDEDAGRIKTAYCQLVTGEYEKALLVLDKVQTKREPVVVYLQAVAYEHKGSHKIAFQHYDVALQLDNTIAEAYKKRGIYRQEVKQWQGSVDDFSEVLKFYPDAYIANRMRGVSYYYIDKFRNAIADFSKYLEQDSTNKEVRSFRAMAYLKANEKLNAYSDFAASDHGHMVNFRDAERLIDSVLLLPDTVQAMRYLDTITDDLPVFTEGYVQKLKVHLARGEWKAAEQCIGRAVRNSRVDAAKEKHSYLLTVMAMTLSRSKHDDDALRTFTDAIKFDGKNALAYLERGRLFLATGKSSKAQSDFRRAFALGNREAGKFLDGAE